MRSMHTAGRRLIQAIGSSSHVRSLLSAERLQTAWAHTARLPLSRSQLTAARKAPATVAWGGAAVLAFGVLMLPGQAHAQTVQPTTPGSSAFTSHGVALEPVGVQVGRPVAYQVPASDSSQAQVAFAHNLDATPAPAAAPAPEDADRAARDAERAPAPVAEAPAAEAPAPAPAAPAWSSPAPGAPISNPYHKTNPSYAAGYHTGVDFAVSVGTPLVAVGDATVVSAGWDGAYGNEIVLKLSDGRFAQYAHMSKLEVKAGQHVDAGNRIGLSGSTGNSTGPHLHFEIRTANRYAAVTDPIGYLKGHGASNF